MKSSGCSSSASCSSSIPFCSGASTVLLCRPTDVKTTVQGQTKQLITPMINATLNSNLIAAPNVNMHSDHYQYLRTLLPPIPHVIERLSFTDLNSWGCSINLALLTSTDCLKWLAEFQEITKTEWKVEKSLSGNHSVGTSNNEPNVSWGVIYRCNPTIKRNNNGNMNPVTTGYSKDCTARLEMKITNQQHQHYQQQQEQHVKTGKQYPCTVNIHFYHNHKTIVTAFPTSAVASTTFSLPTSSSSALQQREHHPVIPTTNVMIPHSTMPEASSNNMFNNEGLINNPHQELVDSTSDIRSSLGPLQLKSPQQPQIQQSSNNVSAANPTTASYSHIQELKMNDTYMVNALTEAAVATRAAVASKTTQQSQTPNFQPG